MVAPRLRLQNAGGDRDPGSAQHREPLPRHPRVAVLDGADHAGDAGGDQRLGAGRGAAVMGAGLERDIGGGAARQLPGLGQRQGFGMGPPARLGPAAPDDPAALHDHAADGGVRPTQALAPAAQRQGQGHEPCVVRTHSSGGAWGRSSLTKSSKSSAAWKFL